MEDNFDQNEFEEFLQDQVKNHRMYPTDAVWREIDKQLHGEKRWPALTIAALMLLSATVLICVYFTPKPNIFAIQPLGTSNGGSTPSQKNNLLNSITVSTPFGQNKSYSPTVHKLRDDITTSNVSNKQAATPSADKANLTKKAAGNIVTAVKIATSVKKPIANTVAHNIVVERTIPENNLAINNTVVLDKSIPAKAAINSADLAGGKKAKVETSSAKDYNDKNMVDDFLKEHANDIKQTAFKAGLKNRFSYQLYIAPSVSYRKLLEDNSIEKVGSSNGPVGVNYVTDVNKVVRHKPGTGIEAGLSFMYNLSNKVRIKSGFQFNMREYSIEAYRSATELASIALIGSNRIDTINTFSIYRNTNGYSSAELVNRYYQISMPLGLEWEVIGNKKVQLNVAGTIQPTYLLNRNAYLLSTNFKNYTESPGMVKQWNLNSNIEAFISYKVGDFKWQLGPQLRYQPYSTFIPEYPIKEHLLDYGIKLGFSKA